MINKVKKILVLFILALTGYNSFSSFSSEISDPSDEELILGTWLSEVDENVKWVFMNNGTCKWYDEGEQSDEFYYSIEHTSPQCGYQVPTSDEFNDSDYSYLKLKDKDEDQAVYCYQIYGLQEKLSISYLSPKASLLVFDRQ